MSTRFERLEMLFAAALALPRGERPGYLARECGDDPELMRRIEALLRADDEAGNLLEPPVEVARAELQLDAPPPESPGTRIGRYTIVEKIGEGGCGSVYLAEQSELVRRRVALKIVKLGMDTREVIARFEAERQALAMMEHPNIARVFDAGATDTGRPFFVMEFVRGVRITDYCEQNNCTIEERLNLFVQVCHAIQHAHHKGVIHRDIKPSNILITLHDGLPVPKVIDFGIAKATQGRLTEETLLTACEQFMGTPAYVSPEQAEGSERDIDTRSDIYSLGTLLYELLTSHPPFEAKQLMAGGLDEMRRQIREIEPPRPSAQLRRIDAKALNVVAARRRTTRGELIKALTGDLDWIVLRCLEKDRGRRYQSAINLATDLRRHLAHEPVEATPPSLAYVFGKFTRRHRGVFAAAAVIVVVLIATTAVSLRLALQARVAEKRAETEATAAKQVIDFLQNDLLAPASPEQTPVWDLKLRTVLDRANLTLEGRLADQPLVEVALRETIATTYNTLGDYATEQQHWEKALALRRRLNGPEAPETLHVIGKLAATHQSQGRYREAEKLVRFTLDIQQRVLGPEHPATLRSMHQLAHAEWDQGRTDEGRRLHLETRRLRESVLGAYHPDTLNSMQDVAQVSRAFGDFATAAYWGTRVLEAKKRVLGAEHPSTLSAMNSLAITHRTQGRITEGIALHEQTLAARRRVLGPEHPDTLVSLTNLSYVLQEVGRLPEAGKLTTEALEIKLRTLGPEHPSTLNSKSLMGMIHQGEGRGAEAAELHGTVLEVRKRTLGPEHPDTLASMHNLGVASRVLGDLDAAAAMLNVALELRRKILNEGHHETLRTMEELGRVLLQQQKFADAVAMLIKPLEFRERTAARAWRTGLVRGLVGEAYIAMKRYPDAEAHLHQAYRVLTAPSDGTPQGGDAIVRETGERIVRLYREWGRPWQADAWRRRVAEWAASTPLHE